MSSTWYPLQGPDGDYANYRITEMGPLALGQLSNLFSEWPILEYFNYTQARNGGPIALMMKDNILLSQGGKNKIFLFDAYGKLFKILDVSGYGAGSPIYRELTLSCFLAAFVRVEPAD